jgi:hypothetical protein
MNLNKICSGPEMQTVFHSTLCIEDFAQLRNNVRLIKTRKSKDRVGAALLLPI